MDRNGAGAAGRLAPALLTLYIRRCRPVIRMALLFPTQGFFPEAQKIFKEHGQFQHDFEKVSEEYTLDEVVMPGNQFDMEVLGAYDVIISRGITAELFRRQAEQPPVVEIPLAGNDLVRTMMQARRTYGDKVFALVGSHTVVYGAEDLARILDIRMRCYERHSDQDWTATVDRAIDDGCQVLLGGVQTSQYAARLGMPCLLMESGKEALWQAFTEAKKVAQVQIVEQRRTQRVKTILDYAYEGVLEIGNDGELVSFNNQAAAMLGLKEAQVGRPAAACISVGRLRDLLLGPDTCENVLVPYNKLQLAVSKSYFKSNGHIWGFIVTFQDVTRLQSMEKSIRKQLHDKGYVAKHTFEDILGGSPRLREAIGKARQYAQADLDVLITGPSGTGKELFAQSIHNASSRQNQPFVAINCAALNENLLESELFGYVEGAFTGASRGGKTGLFEEAHGGTIFLDEVAEISTALQCKLLRVLQEREIMRLGDNRIIPIDIRVIAATNKDLFSYVQEGKFREDLYYRLDVLRVRLPSLNERAGDIPALAQHFVDAYGARYRAGQEPQHLSPEACDLLEHVRWYGNIRQLKNICLRAVVSCPGRVLGAQDIRGVLGDEGSELRAAADLPGIGTAAPRLPDSNHSTQGEAPPVPARAEAERRRIRGALEAAAWNRSRAAELLGVSRSTLWKKMKDYGIE